MPALNTASPVPLYHQLAGVLLASIRSGEYPTGTRIPSEPELARVFGIGRPTVRQATELLIRRHRLERRRGSGTYVVEPPEHVDLLSLAGTLASFREGGIDADSSVIRATERVRVDDDPENPFHAQDAWSFTRLSRVGGESVLLEEIHLDLELFAGIERVPLEGRSLSELVDEQFHMRPLSADQSFRVVQVEGERARLLELDDGAPVLRVGRRLHFAHARAAIFAALYCRTDQLVFSQHLVAASLEGREGEIRG